MRRETDAWQDLASDPSELHIGHTRQLLPLHSLPEVG